MENLKMEKQIKRYTVCTKDDIEPITVYETYLEVASGFIKLEHVKESGVTVITLQKGKGEHIIDISWLQMTLKEFEEFVDLANKFLKKIKEDD